MRWRQLSRRGRRRSTEHLAARRRSRSSTWDVVPSSNGPVASVFSWRIVESNMQKRWYAVQTLARAEKQAERHLIFQGFTVFAPLIWRKVRHARQCKVSGAPLFPGYIFVALDPCRDRWSSINGTVGVLGLIRAGNLPLPLPVGLIEALASAQRSGAQTGGAETFKINQPVRMGTGPFSDLIGRIQRLDAQGRVQVLLDIMGRVVAVRTTLACLSPAEPSAAAPACDGGARH
jgi:transcription antitermination factor NusG